MPTVPGEQYITATMGEYLRLFRSAAIGGLVLSLQAMLELFIITSHLPPLAKFVVVSLNYGIGFIIIHIVHGTLSTKQPAMTAATIASGIDRTGTRQHHLDQVALIVARATRSQLVAILGNVVVVIPMAILLGLMLHELFGRPFPDQQTAQQLIAMVNPLFSGSLLFAAITGVCLFLSGLISGYYDNLAAYYRIPQRMKLLALPGRIFGEAAWSRFCGYVENNLGALAGNLALGILFGSVVLIGNLTWLPLDVRHVAFSSAYLDFGLQSLDYAVPWQAILVAAAGVALVGLVNLAVSFSLSLFVAYRSLGLQLPRGALLVRTIRLFLRRPGEFLFPPRNSATQANHDRDGRR